MIVLANAIGDFRSLWRACERKEVATRGSGWIEGIHGHLLREEDGKLVLHVQITFRRRQAALCALLVRTAKGERGVRHKTGSKVTTWPQEGFSMKAASDMDISVTCPQNGQ